MVDQPRSPPLKRARKSGTLSLPEIDAGMNKKRPNVSPIPDRGEAKAPTGKPKKTEDEAKILERARKRINREISAQTNNRKAQIEDRKFMAGDQWPSDVAQQRSTEKRPCLTINRMPTFVHQVTNASRENRPSIMVRPVGSKADKEGAKIFRGLIRQIEKESHADIAYDTALSDAVISGRGWIRLRIEWKAENSFDQTIVIDRVRNPFTVYMDPDCQQPDCSDAKWGCVTDIWSEDEFKLKWPDAQIVPFNVGGQGENFKEWETKEGIRVAEYYEIQQDPADLVSLSTGYVGYEDELDDITKARMKNGAVTEIDRRESHRRKVMCYHMTAIEILEEYEWLGNWVPLIPVLGEEIDIEGKVQHSGLIRNAKDAQRMLNYWRTWYTETIALAPKAKWLLAEGQDEGWEKQWKTSNTNPRPYITYKPTDIAGHMVPPPIRIQEAEVPAGVVQASNDAAQDMMATTGIRFDSTLQERMYDESGKALAKLRAISDEGTFHFHDNLRRAMEFLGRQIVGLISGKKIYTRRQVATILREDDTDQNVTIDPQMGQAYQEKAGDKGTMRYFNPSFGDYGVTVDIGPSYASKREQASESMMDFVKALPNTAQLVMDLIAAEMDWPGAEKIAARLAKAIPPQMLTPDMKDVPPQVQAMIQNLEQQTKMLQQQLQQAMKAIEDKQADRNVALEKIQADYEAKLIGIIAKTEDSAKKLALDQAELISGVLMEKLRMEQAKSEPKKEKTDA